MDASELARLRALCEDASPLTCRLDVQRAAALCQVFGESVPALLDEVEDLRARVSDQDALLEAAQAEIERLGDELFHLTSETESLRAETIALNETQGRDSAALVEMRGQLNVAVEALEYVDKCQGTGALARSALAKIRGGGPNK
jgi:chromosome segregation ATPase